MALLPSSSASSMMMIEGMTVGTEELLDIEFLPNSAHYYYVATLRPNRDNPDLLRHVQFGTRGIRPWRDDTGVGALDSQSLRVQDPYDETPRRQYWQQTYGRDVTTWEGAMLVAMRPMTTTTALQQQQRWTEALLELMFLW